MADRQRAKILRRQARVAKRRGQAVARDQRIETREVEAFIDRELGDRERVADAILLFAELAREVPELAPALLTPEELLRAFIEVPAAQPGDPPFVDRARPLFATRAYLRRARDAAWRALGADVLESEDEGKALVVVGSLLDAALQDLAGKPANMLALTLFLASYEHAFLGGTLAVLLFARSQRTRPAAGAGRFAAALERPEFVKELERLGLEERDPVELARLCAQVPEPPLRLAPIHIDGVLHGVLETRRFFDGPGQALYENGLTPEVEAELRASFERAFEADMTPELVDEVYSRSVARALGSEDEDEGVVDEDSARERASIASLLAVPPLENVHLRAVYLASLAATRFCAGEAWPFIERICSDPEDVWALEEYERYLLGKGAEERARRVIRFARAVRLSRSETRAASPLPPEA